MRTILTNAEEYYYMQCLRKPHFCVCVDP